MTWVVTYRLPALEGGAELTVPMTDDWCDDRGIYPGDLGTPEHAAWAMALTLGRNGQDDAELLAVEDIIGGTP